MPCKPLLVRTLDGHGGMPERVGMKGRLMTRTGLLLALASIARLAILRPLLTSVHVPQSVHDEVV